MFPADCIMADNLAARNQTLALIQEKVTNLKLTVIQRAVDGKEQGQTHCKSQTHSCGPGFAGSRGEERTGRSAFGITKGRRTTMVEQNNADPEHDAGRKIQQKVSMSYRPPHEHEAKRKAFGVPAERMRANCKNAECAPFISAVMFLLNCSELLYSSERGDLSRLNAVNSGTRLPTIYHR